MSEEKNGGNIRKFKKNPLKSTPLVSQNTVHVYHAPVSPTEAFV